MASLVNLLNSTQSPVILSPKGCMTKALRMNRHSNAIFFTVYDQIDDEDVCHVRIMIRCAVTYCMFWDLGKIA